MPESCRTCRYFRGQDVIQEELTALGTLRRVAKANHCCRYPRKVARSPLDWCGEFKPIENPEAAHA